jgi:MFS family permease
MTAASDPLAPPRPADEPIPFHAREPKAPAAAWLALWVLIGVLIFAYVDRQIISLVAAPMSATLDLGNVQLGLVQGVGFAVFAVLASYPISWLADRFDRRLVLIGCIVLWTMGTAACGLAQNFIQLFAGAMALAAGEVGLAPVVLSAIPDLFGRRERATANLIYYLAAILGAGAAFGLGGLLLSAIEPIRPILPAPLRSLESWRLAFFAVAAPAPVFVLLVANLKLKRRVGLSPVRSGADEGRLWPYLRDHWRTVALVFGGIGLFTFALNAALVWMPLGLARAFKITPAQSGMAIGLAITAGVLAGTGGAWLALRRLASRIGRGAALRIGAFGMLAAAPIVFLIAMVTAPMQGFILLCLALTAGAVVGSMTPSILQDIAPADVRARVMGIYTMVVAVASGASVITVGAVADLLGHNPRAVVIAIAAVGAPAWLIGGGLLILAERRFAGTLAALEAR